MLIKLEEQEMMGENPNIPIVNGAFLAGGSIRAWFCGDEKVCDYDIFFTSIDSLNFYKQEFLKNCTVTRDEEFIFECLLNNKKIQLIKRIFPQTIEELFDRFDFHLCQFVFTTTGIWTTKKAILSVLRKKLSYNNHQKGYEIDTLRRAFKYAKKGYQPCVGCLVDLAKPFQNEVDLEKQIEFYPDGTTKRVIRFD